jgi:hypothetical protein
MRISPRGMNIQNMQGNPQWPPKERCKKGEPEGQMSPEGARDQPPSRGWGGSLWRCRKGWKCNNKEEECPKYAQNVQCCWKDVDKVRQKIPQQRVWGEYVEAQARKSTPQQRVWGGAWGNDQKGQQTPPKRRERKGGGP